MTEPETIIELKGEGCSRGEDPLDAIPSVEPHIKVIDPDRKVTVHSRLSVHLMSIPAVGQSHPLLQACHLSLYLFRGYARI